MSKRGLGPTPPLESAKERKSSLKKSVYYTHIFSMKGVFLLIFNDQKCLVPHWKIDSGRH